MRPGRLCAGENGLVHCGCRGLSWRGWRRHWWRNRWCSCRYGSLSGLEPYSLVTSVTERLRCRLAASAQCNGWFAGLNGKRITQVIQHFDRQLDHDWSILTQLDDWLVHASAPKVSRVEG